MYQILVRIVGRYAPIITFPVAVVLGVIGYNLERILYPTKLKEAIINDDTERGLTEKREERLLHLEHDYEKKASKSGDEIYTRRNNIFDKNDAKLLKK
jgi:hypothetical protein